MYEDRPAGDRMLVALLAGHARHLAGYAEPAEDEITAAVAELRAVTTRPDLLAERAGILLGFYASAGLDGERDQATVAALYLIEAGADLASLPYWIDQGANRAWLAGQVPFGAKVTGL
jgi:hypothetical protein